MSDSPEAPDDLAEETARVEAEIAATRAELAAAGIPRFMTAAEVRSRTLDLIYKGTPEPDDRDADRESLIRDLASANLADEFILPLLDQWAEHSLPSEGTQGDLDVMLTANATALSAYRANQARRAENRAKGEWSDPLPLPTALRPVPPFDIDALLPSVCAAFVRDTVERMQCPADYVAAPLIAAAGSVIGRQCVIYPKEQDDWAEVPNLWALNIGEPGEMKTPASEAAVQPLVRLEAEARTVWEAEQSTREWNAEVREKMLKRLERDLQNLVDGKKVGEEVTMENLRDARDRLRVEETDDIRGARRYIVNDATVEKLGMLLNANPIGLTQRRDEIIGWFNLMERDGHENDRAFFNEAWNGKNAYTYDRVERGTLLIEAACISVIGNIPPGPLKRHLHKVFGKGETNDGMIQRFQMMVWPDPSSTWVNVDRWPNTVARTRMFEIFSRLANLDPATFGLTVPEDGLPYLRFTPEAQALFNRWRTVFEQSIRQTDDSPVLVSHFTKYRGLLPALALIVHLIECAATNTAGPVTAQAVERAIRWVAYLAEHARRVYDSLIDRADTVAGLIGARLRAGAFRPTETFTATMIAHKDWGGVGDDIDDIRAALRVLDACDWVRGIERQTTGKGGRPTVDYKVNPLVLARGTKART